MTFKNCESLYCTPVTYIILYSNYTSIFKKNFNLEKEKMALWEKAFSQLEIGFRFKTAEGFRGSVKASLVPAQPLTGCETFF